MRLKRVIDFVVALLGLIVSSPVLLLFMAAIFFQDFKSPLYLGQRVGQFGRPFKMYKLRSMVSNAASLGGVSTATDDRRITRVGAIVRRYKLDELMQLINVLNGSMSLVGPRPNVQIDTERYTSLEAKMLAVRPGITDFASIVFSDEGEILEGSEDPDLKYNQVIRPWKSRLALFYIKNRSLKVDATLILLTLLAIVSREKALTQTSCLLQSIGADAELVNIAKRKEKLVPMPPPGADVPVSSIC